ncbi:MAG: WYL domain-containing protein [Candidatus Eremiobacteraeota bacterium]|nr:WYL domain-containing protein [Candidatus Eremiobacteraeota bacterium]
MAGPKQFPSRNIKRRVADAGEPIEAVERKIWLLLELLRHRSVQFQTYERLYERSDRSFKRDLQHLRKIGERTGFTVSNLRDGIVTLQTVDASLKRTDKSSKALSTLLQSAAHALGAPVEHQMRGLTEAATNEERQFLYFALPQLVQGTHVASVYETLKDAWSSSARVRFKYGDDRVERVVEPHAVLNRSGRYYLIGFDVGRGKGWRYFALDRIEGMPQRAGTCRPRALDESFTFSDTMGMLHGGPAVDVTVELSPLVAASATSRLWQRNQKVEPLPDGGARITFSVSDPDEVIRWAFGFATQAKIIAPPTVVERGCQLLQSSLDTWATGAIPTV